MAKLIFSYLFHFLSLHLLVLTRLRTRLAAGSLSRNSNLSIDLIIRTTTKWSFRTGQREGIYCVIIQTLKAGPAEVMLVAGWETLCHQTVLKEAGGRHCSFLLKGYSFNCQKEDFACDLLTWSKKGSLLLEPADPSQV